MPLLMTIPPLFQADAHTAQQEKNSKSRRREDRDRQELYTENYTYIDFLILEIQREERPGQVGIPLRLFFAVPDITGHPSRATIITTAIRRVR